MAVRLWTSPGRAARRPGHCPGAAMSRLLLRILGALGGLRRARRRRARGALTGGRTGSARRLGRRARHPDQRQGLLVDPAGRLQAGLALELLQGGARLRAEHPVDLAGIEPVIVERLLQLGDLIAREADRGGAVRGLRVLGRRLRWGRAGGQRELGTRVGVWTLWRRYG